VATNNQAEALAMWKRIEIEIDKGHKEIIIIGDSKLLIHCLVKKLIPKDPLIGRLMNMIIARSEELITLKDFHIKRVLNKEVDKKANHACTLR